MECPSVRCKGTLEVAASGVLAGGQAIDWFECDRCGRVVEREAVLDHPALFDGEGTV